MTLADFTRQGGGRMNGQQRRQRRHEDYWGRCWTVPLGAYLGAEVRSSRPDNDAHDIDFWIQRSDGMVATSWGEVTGTYYDNREARWLWDSAPVENQSGLYVDPDARTGMAARDRVARKRSKYRELVGHRGKGHLLVLLHSPLTTRSTRVFAEGAIRDLFESEPAPDSDPFETVWLGYRLPLTVLPEMEDPEHVFHDGEEGNRHNFLKCIWSGRSR